MELTSTLIEKALINNVLLDNELLLTVTEILEPKHFLEPKHELIYQTITSLYEQGKDASVTSVVSALHANGELNNAGGVEYLRQIITPTELHSLGADPIGLSEMIREEAKRRDLRIFGEKISKSSMEHNGTTADEVQALAETLLQDIVAEDAVSASSSTVKELFPEIIDALDAAKTRDINAPAGIPSGITALDRVTNGFKPGQMIIIAARPAIGKSTLAVDFARNAAFLAGKTVLFFSIEMDKIELANRIISAEARVESSRMKTGDLTEEDWMNIKEARSRIENGTFIIDDSPKTSLSRVRSVALRQKYRPEGLDMIVIDYLGLMEIPSTGRRSDSRQTDIASLSRGLKVLAKELEVPIIVLSQLNRKSEERTDGKPLLSDLRESGTLEQDADIVFLIHRPEASDPNNRPNETDLILAKHRGGPTAVIPLVSMLSFCKFVPGEGTHGREDEFLPVDENGEPRFASTLEETPW